MATNQLFRRKYADASTNRCKRCRSRGRSSSRFPGCTSANQKNVLEAIQMASPTAEKLKRERTPSRCPFCHIDMTRLSRATIEVAAAGPKRRTAAKTKASDTEIFAGTAGIFTENDPVSRVKAARTSHSFGAGVTA